MAAFFIATITLILQHATRFVVASTLLEIQVEPGHEVVANPGANVTLACKVVGKVDQQTITLKWLFQNDIQGLCHFSSVDFIGTTAGPDIPEKRCNLTIGPMDKSSEGEYKYTNECDDTSTNNCEENAHCVDTVQGFECTCKDGYTLDKTSGNCKENNKKRDPDTNVAVVVSCVFAGLLLTVVIALAVYTVMRSKGNLGQANLTLNSIQDTAAVESTVAMLVSSYEERIAQASVASYESKIKQRESASKGTLLPGWALKWEILWSDLLLDNEVLGRGNFGEVRSGAVKISGRVTRAAIKMLKEQASSAEKDDFLHEFKTMSSIGYHSNIVWLLGACQHQGVLYVALEYLMHGDLRSYLRTARSQSDTDEDVLSAEQLVKFALDIAKGMEHLAKARVIHRDLAARNILVGEDLVAKVSDFGLSRGEDVYVQMSSKRVPLRWLAIESVRHNIYTTQSDVWSFGILLWEIATVGATPYPTISSESLPAKLKKGYRMPKPSNCDDHSYDLMRKCWDEDPEKRPTFTNLVATLSEMATNTDENSYLVMKSIKYVNLDAICPEFDDK
ncbi:fibroblast growth factor receptor-like isoform X2 [Acanthaster planci]|uniref:receptor protein-tyrosine kinase n=1 Tax=Acanthaster planci TaxID=133434 RepID=A0A8B7XUB2_ACAPL|nr:fibroblast growth factor receptor-like isoform X2 [Acanthaster planci]